MRGRAHHPLSLIRWRLTLGLDQIYQLHMNLGDNLVPGRSEWKLGYSRKGALWTLPTPSLPGSMVPLRWQVLAFIYYVTSASAALSRACVLISRMGDANANPPRLLCR